MAGVILTSTLLTTRVEVEDDISEKRTVAGDDQGKMAPLLAEKTCKWGELEEGEMVAGVPAVSRRG